MPLDPQTAALLAELPKDWYSDEQYTLEQLRSRVQHAAAKKPCGTRTSALRGGRKVPLWAVEDKQILKASRSVAARIYRPVKADGVPQPAVVYFHGGGYVLGDLDSHDGLCRALASLSGCTVVAVEYRLAPEHPFPAAVEDALAAVQWVAGNAPALGVDPRRIAVAGDSAGGSLSAVTCLLAKRAGGPAIAFQLLLYPRTGGVPLEHPSLALLQDCYALTPHDIRLFWRSYTRTDDAPHDERVSPLLAPDLAGLPPALVVTAEFDCLRDEGADYARRLAAAGVRAEHKCYEGQVHGFLNLTCVTDCSVQAVRECAAALAAALHAQPGQPAVANGHA